MASSTYPNLVVKFDGEMVATGKWGDIKDKAQGGNPLHPLYKAKYTQLIFALCGFEHRGWKRDSTNFYSWKSVLFLDRLL